MHIAPCLRRYMLCEKEVLELAEVHRLRVHQVDVNYFSYRIENKSLAWYN